MPTLALVGPSSLIGREILQLLEERPRVERLLPLSEKAVGEGVPFRGAELAIDELDADAIGERPEVVIFATGSARSQRWAKRFAEAGSRVVDLSGLHRLDAQVPLAGLDPFPAGRLIAIPGAAALAAARLLAGVFDAAAAPALTATLLVPVSAAGHAGINELSQQSAGLLGGRPTKRRKFPHRIAFNVIPEVGEVNPVAASGDSLAERSFREELRRLLRLPLLRVSVTAVRVPVFYGLSMVLAGTTGTAGTAGALQQALVSAGGGVKPHVKLLDGAHVYPMPSLTVGDPSILVGRVREDGAGGFQLFAALDPLRLVAAAAVTAALGKD